MRETEHKEIDGHKYVCEMMPATLAQTTFMQLVELVGKPVLFMAVGAFKEDGEHKSSPDLATLAELGLVTLFDRLSPEEADEVIKAVLNGVLVEKKGDVLKCFDEHFRGRVLSMYKVFQWALAVNYRDFVDAATSSGIPSKLAAVVETLKEAGLASAMSAFKEKTSTNESGDSAPPTKE